VPKFPEPPTSDELARIPPELMRLPAGAELWRIYFSGGSHPTDWNEFRSFGPLPTARFDHHLEPPHEQDRGILYAAVHGPTCLAQVFQEKRNIDRERRSPVLVAFTLVRDISVLDLSSTWPTAAGASMVICSGPRPRARRWSQAIYDAYPDVEGLWYPSSMYANRPCIALYERAADALATPPRMHRLLSDPLLDHYLLKAAQDIRYSLAPVRR
jgi:hypothetical protein